MANLLRARLRLFSLFFLIGLLDCARHPASQAMLRDSMRVSGPPYRLSVQVIDDLGDRATGAFVRVMECCHTEAGPCGRIPVDEAGKASLHVCPDEDGIVRITLTPDPKRYRVPPINEFELHSDSSVTVTVTRHEKVLDHLKSN